MATAAQWDELVNLIRQSTNPHKREHSELIKRFYELAFDEGPACLRSFGFNRERIEDIIQDSLASGLDQILAAETPKAYFRICLVNRANSWLRKRKRDNALEKNLAGFDEESGCLGEKLQAKRLLQKLQEELSPRDLQILQASMNGEKTEAIAAAFGTTSANVYQILSRIRRNFREES